MNTFILTFLTEENSISNFEIGFLLIIFLEEFSLYFRKYLSLH
jgi:hypothetical protein